MTKEKLQNTLEIVRFMATGALALILGIAIYWSIANADVVVKAIKYPEAIRQMKIQVTVAQTASK